MLWGLPWSLIQRMAYARKPDLRRRYGGRIAVLVQGLGALRRLMSGRRRRHGSLNGFNQLAAYYYGIGHPGQAPCALRVAYAKTHAHRQRHMTTDLSHMARDIVAIQMARAGYTL